MIRIFFSAIAVCVMTAESSSMMINQPRRSAETCGIAKSKSGLIVRGQDFPRGSFPWVTALMHTKTGPPAYFCAGTLISKAFVISAAHCILEKGATKELLPRNVLAIFGAHDLSDVYETERIVLSPKAIFIHDDWNPKRDSFDADVSLLEFDEGVIHFSTYIKPICLWESATEPTVTEGIVTGWGKSEDLSKLHENKPKLIKVKIQNNADCLPGEGLLAEISSTRTFCGGLRNGSGVCLGDSGGGLFIEVDGVYHLKGIVSSSLVKESECNVWKNAVYTNVLKFRNWIKKITGSALVSSTQTVKKFFCSFKMTKSACCGQVNTCTTNQAIGREDYVVGSELNTSVEQFLISNNTKVSFLPARIGEKFPNLKDFQITGCGLRVVRKHYFKDLGKVLHMSLNDNKITTIEKDSFKDLISVKWFNLHHNMIETLDGKLFATMVELNMLYLQNNKIKSLSSKTFDIAGGSLTAKYGVVNLESNICLDGYYDTHTWGQLETDIQANCTL